MMEQSDTPRPITASIFGALAILVWAVALWNFLNALAAGRDLPSEYAAQAAAMRSAQLWSSLGTLFAGLCLWWMAVVIDLLARIASKEPTAAARPGAPQASPANPASGATGGKKGADVYKLD